MARVGASGAPRHREVTRHPLLPEGRWARHARRRRGIPEEFLSFTDVWLADKTVGWTAFNPMRPEPAQRNVALTLADVKRVSGVKTAPILSIYAKFGLGEDDQLRVLVSEGASLLAWVGVFQREPTTLRQRRLLQHLVPALRRRLSTERALASAPATHALFLAALEEIAAPGFVLTETGSVLEANAVGRAWLEHDRRQRVRLLREAIRPPALDASAFRVTRVRSRGVADRFLVVRAAEDAEMFASRAAARRRGLSRREAQVLALLTQGLSNRTIAAELAVSERTVEAHLTRMFEKVQLGTRAQLIVRANRGG